MADDAAISVVGLTKKFGSQTIWEDINFDVPRGEITVILGPSGTGKSVLLKHFVGLLKPTSGHVYVEGRDIPTLNEHDLFEVRKKFGVLFQDGALFGSLNIQDNVAFPLREHTKLSEGLIRELVQEKLELVGLQGAEKKFPGEISGGMKKRAGLARALVLDPEILLFDEPDSGLDPVRTAFLNLLTVDLKKRLGPTIVIVTHHIDTARTIPDYIGLIFARRLVMFGTRKEMFDSKKDVVHQFLTGSTEGPIGMSEEKDAAGGDSSGNGDATAKLRRTVARKRSA
jgi:phospholipid/cholesterol/gamma-HCH transport system ATP-binding protein